MLSTCSLIPPQSLALANKAAFKNCLVAMRPKTKNCELPSRHDVETHISNEFTKFISDLKQRISVGYSSATFAEFYI
jgi:hypothetical protein